MHTKRAFGTSNIASFAIQHGQCNQTAHHNTTFIGGSQFAISKKYVCHRWCKIQKQNHINITTQHYS